MSRDAGRRGPRMRLWIVLGAAAAGLCLPALAWGHLERPSYWPDPRAEKVEGKKVGGKVPKSRSLSSALRERGPSETHVVCKGPGGRKSLAILERSLRTVTRNGYRVRPSEPKKDVSRRQAERLGRINRKLARRCEHDSVQDAVNAADNHDRVVVMPGRYREPDSRKQPVNDPRCADMTQKDSGGSETPSYRYQVTCPNDQNLIYVQGRAVLDEPPPEPPLDNRQGIPDEGACVKCNLQIEGSGARPVDVVFDAGKNYESSHPEAKPDGFGKDVILRVDRADGLVAKNFLARGAREHGIYVEETDGYRIDRVKMFWAADYGNLTFTSDHGLYLNCDGMGSGDAALYPGGAPETGEQVDTTFYPDGPRVNTTIKKCDMRGSVLGYSGSMGNAVRITASDIYGNVAGISSDTISASGHPGFPSDSMEIDNNYIYSNNLDLYGMEDPPVEPIVGVLPSGVGIFWAGHNNGRVHNNWIFDNWRNGTMLLAVPDAVITGTGGAPEGNVNPGISCPTAPDLTTSCANRYFANRMGVAPPGFKPSVRVEDFGNKVGGSDGRLPNGTDFWWDEFSGNTGNCWYQNIGFDGTPQSITGPGQGTPPDQLPSDCATSTGDGDSAKESQLAACFLARESGEAPEACDWYTLPPKPGSAEAQRRERRIERAIEEFARTDRAREIERYFDERRADADG